MTQTTTCCFTSHVKKALLRHICTSVEGQLFFGGFSLPAGVEVVFVSPNEWFGKPSEMLHINKVENPEMNIKQYKKNILVSTVLFEVKSCQKSLSLGQIYIIEWCTFLSQTLNVWYIHLHLP